MIPTCEPLITLDDALAVQAALRLGHVALGPEVEWFEEAVAKVVGKQYAIATSSGSAALQIAVKTVPWRQPIRVPALTFMATAEAVINAGAVLKIVDHGELADISVNFYGHPPIGAAIIEDACEGLGAQPIGQVAITCLSFNGNKIITTGGGGMVLTNDAILAGKMRAMASHYRAPGLEYRHTAVGSNYRMPAMNAALGLSQIARLDALVATKRRIAGFYHSEIAPRLATPLLEPPGTLSTYWMPVFLLDRPAAPVISAMQAQGVQARAVWYPLSRQAPFLGAPRCRLADDLWSRGIILPCSVGITEEEQRKVVAALERGIAVPGSPS